MQNIHSIPYRIRNLVYDQHGTFSLIHVMNHCKVAIYFEHSSTPLLIGIIDSRDVFHLCDHVREIDGGIYLNSSIDARISGGAYGS